MKAALLLSVFFILSFEAAAQEESVFLSADAQVTAGYQPWKSFSKFRKFYNSSNDTSLTRKLGSLSDQYGISLGIDCFVSSHYYTGVDYRKSYGKASAKFDNGTKRIMTSQISTITAYLGWLQATKNGYWTLTTGFDFAFGRVRSFLIFDDGTRYVHTGGLSGEFHDVAFGLPLKFEYTRNLTERLGFRAGFQADFYFQVYEGGMQNAFVTQTSSGLSLGDNLVLFDVSGLSLNAGLCYKFVKK